MKGFFSPDFWNEKSPKSSLDLGHKKKPPIEKD